MDTAIRNTPYDDVFRTLLVDCPQLVIPIINETFGTDYAADEQIVLSQNEHFLMQQDGAEDKRITDGSFSICGHKYLFECQSTEDSSILIRIFEYEMQIALEQNELIGNKLIITIPNTAVLYLRSTKTTPDFLEVQIITPGGDVSYEIPVKKVKSYSLDMIFERKLLFLIPFYIFTQENKLKEYNSNAESLEELKAQFLTITRRLEDLALAGEITAYYRSTIVDMTNIVVDNLARNYDNVREGVKSIMGGRVLEYEAKTIRNEGVAEGRAEGAKQEKEKNALAMLKEHLGIALVARCTELTEEEVKQIAIKNGLAQ